jgi:ribosomal protein S18 acetylase RimI-like enzyme
VVTSQWATYEPDRPPESGPGSLKIRPAVAADCTDVAAITHERDAVPVATALERCTQDLEKPDHLLLVADVDAEIAGFARAARWKRPPDATPDVAPDGWYLFGVVIRDRWRRRGIGLELTRRRIAWIADRADEAWYFANARNRASIDLHARLGFVEVTRDFAFPGASFEGGVGVLCRVDLAPRP